MGFQLLTRHNAENIVLWQRGGSEVIPAGILHLYLGLHSKQMCSQELLSVVLAILLALCIMPVR